MAAEWADPWRELRSREHLIYGLRRLPEDLGAIYWPRGERAAIIIDDRLSQPERKAALCHELVHDERGGGASMEGMPESWRPVVVRDEETVDRTVALKLVPLDRLEQYVERIISIGEPIHAVAVAEEFEVPLDVAQRALCLLDRRRRGA